MSRQIPGVVASVRVLAAVLLFASGCTTTSERDKQTPPTESTDGQRTLTEGQVVELPCAETIDANAEVPNGYETILDSVGLPTAKTADTALQTSKVESDPPPSYWAKSGLVMRASVATTIEVNGPPDVAQIGWGSPADFGSTVTTEGCPGDGWMAFAGGFLVVEPRCIELSVTAAGEQETVAIGVGAPCEGQQPPPWPTDP
jgi:hypothetical protein